MFRRKNAYLISIFTFLIPEIAFADSHDVFGLWQSEARDGHIRIEDCGDGTPCGTLVWAEPQKMVSDRDVRNKERHLRTRSLVGVPIVWGLERDEKRWSNGKIYNPEDGKTFRASLKRQSKDILKVKGCLGPICISNRWTRVPSLKEVTPS